MFEHKLLKVSFIFIFLLFLFVFLFHHFSIISYENLISIHVAAILTTINFIIAVISIEWLEKRAPGNALANFMKGMIIRMVVLILLIIFSFKFLDIKRNSFIFSILIFYIYYLVIEIIFIVKREA